MGFSENRSHISKHAQTHESFLICFKKCVIYEEEEEEEEEEEVVEMVEGEEKEINKTNL